MDEELRKEDPNYWAKRYWQYRLAMAEKYEREIATANLQIYSLKEEISKYEEILSNYHLKEIKWIESLEENKKLKEEIASLKTSDEIQNLFE